ncbi:MAG: mechanosensitive ion channel domain-containing protein, partial [Pseudomonadota bacterium]
MTLLGLVVVWFAARAAGLRFSSRFGEEPAQDRPARVVAAVGGIAIACMLAIIPAFLVYGAGSKTIELVSWQIDLFASAALISLAVVAMMERVHDVAPAKRAEVEPRAVAQNINAVLTGLFLIVTAAQVLSFMYPEPEMAMLGAMVGVSAAAVALIWLAQRHRHAIAALVGTVLPRSRERVRQSAWAVFAFYVALSILIAFGRVILGMSEPVSLVLAPGTALLVGVFIYYLALLALAQAFGSPDGAAEGGDVERVVLGPRRSFARALGGSAGLLFFLDRLGFPVTGDDGRLSFAALAALVIISAFGVWVWLSTTIDRRMALETGGSDLQEDGGDGEGGTGLSRLATLLPLFRNIAFFGIFAVAALILLWNSGVNITPLFASAGIIGLAIGFGAQSLVRDVISGFFFLIDDAFRMGEYIETGGLKGR